MFQTAIRSAALVCLTTGAAQALPSTPWKQAEAFAICAGRLGALAARQHAIKDPALTTTLQKRDDFRLLLEAVLPSAQKHGVSKGDSIRWQSSGWSDIAYLLADEQYSFDASRAERARLMALRRIADCQALLLPKES